MAGFYDDDDMLGGELLGYDMLGAPVVVRRGAPMTPMRRPALNPAMLQRGGQQPFLRPGAMGTPLQGPPPWRGPQLAPGVMAPFEGLVPLQLQPDVNAGLMTSAFPLITFSASPQKPFRGQRMFAVVNRSAGAAAVQPRIQGGIFVGTDLQAASFGDTPLEIYQPTSFGAEMVLTPAGPGISIRVPVTSVPAVPVGESVAISIVILGRYIA